MGKSPVIVDAGANIGTFSLFILSICPDAFLYVIEPSTQAFHILERNAALAKRPNWSVFQAALWKEDGSISFENMETSVASRIAGLTGSETTGSVESVPALRLDSFIAKHIRKPIDLLKLDIEGAEEAVLDANDSVLDETQHLLIEIHPTQADEAKITSLIHKHFPYVRRIQDRDNKELSLVFASHTIPSF